jgi:hypothetical protein
MGDWATAAPPLDGEPLSLDAELPFGETLLPAYRSPAMPGEEEEEEEEDET